MTPEQIAEALERARYEQLRGDGWAQLRETERSTRVAVAQQALEAAGILAWVDEVVTRMTVAEDLAGYLPQRDAEIARLHREHDEEVAALEVVRRAAVDEVRQQHEQALAGVVRKLEVAVRQLSALRTEHAAVLAELEQVRAGRAATDAVLEAAQ